MRSYCGESRGRDPSRWGSCSRRECGSKLISTKLQRSASRWTVGRKIDSDRERSILLEEAWCLGPRANAILTNMDGKDFLRWRFKSRSLFLRILRKAGPESFTA